MNTRINFIDDIDERLLAPLEHRSKGIHPWANHEIWRVCNNCGAYLDLRMNDTCEECGHKYED